MRLKYEPSSEPLHISVKQLLGTFQMCMGLSVGLYVGERYQISDMRFRGSSSSSSLLLSSLELSDTQVYEPSIRALLGTASHLCEVVVPKLRTRI